MTDQEILEKKLKDEILKNVPSNGTSIGNKKLIVELRKTDKDFNDDLYWKVRNKLIEDGKLSKARGKGGAVYLLEENQVHDKKKREKRSKVKEQDIYNPFLKVITDYWVKENDIDDFIYQLTANQGKRKTGGRWTRPDFLLISMKNYQYYYGKIMDVITFEIKPEDNFGIESVFETAAQSVFAHKSYLCIHLPSGKPETEEFDRIQRQCDLFGVGLIIFEQPSQWETYEIIIDPKRKDPDPYEVNMFLKQQLSEMNKETLAKKIK